MSAENKAIVRSFVTETLGCGCPDSVFERIESSFTPGAFALGKPLGHLVIGGRLLVYLVETDDLSEIRAVLPALLAQGRAERDRKGYNRFRLVVAAERAEPLTGELDALFMELAPSDEKAHLHVLLRDGYWERVRAALAGA